MKKIFYSIILLSAACIASCINDKYEDIASDTQGVAAVSFNLPDAVTRAYDSNAYPWKDNCDIRIYKNTELGRELIRHYFGPDEMPAQLWLLAGDYHISVELGSKAPASFTEPSHFGEADFTIDAGRSTDVAVTCNLINTIIEVEYDATIAKIFDTDYRTVVQIADTYDSAAAVEGTNSLTYTSSRRGYFMLPEGTEKFSFCFLGNSSDDKVGEIHKHFTRELEQDKLAGYCYKVRFAYSPDPEGHLSMEFTVTVDTSTKDEDHFVGINPSPKPVISLEQGDIAAVQDVAGELNYVVSSSDADLTHLKISADLTDYEIDLTELTRTATGHDGIDVDTADLRNVKVTLGKPFFDKLTGGSHVLTFTAKAASNAEGSARSQIRTPGTVALEPVDKWNAKGEISAYLFAEGAGNVQVQYRVKNSGGGWTTVAAKAGEDHLYKAEFTGIKAETEYEYQLLVGGETTGAVQEAATDSGPQIYNADFEKWSGAGTSNSPLCPYLDVNSDQWWDSGNEGSKIMGVMLTTNVTDRPSSSQGQYAARLASRSVLSTLATGNIFLGKFVGTKNTTKGVCRFGHAFDFTYRPTALRFWYKSKVGTINVGSGAPGVNRNDQDTQQIYCLLCAMTGPCIVDTSKPDSFLNLTNGIKTIGYCSTPIANITTSSANDKTANVIAYGVWESSESQDEWTQHTLKLTYNDEYDDVPTWLMLTAAANKFGDYYVGCDSNELYLDDIEFIY